MTPEEIDEEAARVQEALGEASCATTPADHVLVPSVEGYKDSGTAVYGHPTCRNGYVVDLVGAVAGRQLFGQSWIQPSLDPFTCLLNYGYIALYRKQGASYVKVGENLGLGTWNIGRFGPVCGMAGVLTTPAAGDYKVVVSAGNIFGGLYPVRFLYF